MTIKEKIRGLKTVLFFEAIYLFFYGYSIELCHDITHKIAKKSWQKAILLVLIFPYLFIKGIICVILEQTVCKIATAKWKKKDREKEYKYEFSIVAIAKDEAEYIREWVAYYRVVCKDNVHIYLYDNGSTDGMKEEIQDYIDQGFITYIDYPGQTMQMQAYHEAVDNFKNESRYLAFIDIDEFIYVEDSELEGRSLTEYVRDRIEAKGSIGGIGINWKLMGSMGYKEKQPGLVTETFLEHGQEDHWGNTNVKTICNPRIITNYISCHYGIFKLGYWNIAPDGKRQRLWWNKKPDWSQMAVNHYFCKSEQEFWKKRDRGRAASGGKYDFNRFINYDQNGIRDEGMLKYSDEIKMMMER